jgi:hypothetical protein
MSDGIAEAQKLADKFLAGAKDAEALRYARNHLDQALKIVDGRARASLQFKGQREKDADADSDPDAAERIELEAARKAAAAALEVLERRLA